MMQFSTRMTISVASSILLALPTPVVWAESCEIPQGKIHSRPVSDDGLLRTFTGSVTPFGSISGGLTLYPNIDGTFTGKFAFKSHGSKAYGTISGYFTGDTSYIERLTIKEAKGKHSNTSGYADIKGVLNPDGTAIDMVTGGLICLH